MSVKDGNGSRAHAVTLGALIRELRESWGWSQSRLASALCAVANHETVTREIVSRWETGKRVPGPWWLRHLATVLQTPLRSWSEPAWIVVAFSPKCPARASRPWSPPMSGGWDDGEHVLRCAKRIVYSPAEATVRGSR
jgi:DNA-binding transcriptional regulator YiaG